MSLKKAGSVQIGGGTASSAHTYSQEEKEAFVDHINDRLSGDPDLKGLVPVSPDGNDLFVKQKDGRLFSKLINVAVKDTIDERTINKKANMSVYQQLENQNLVVNSAKGIGCTVVNIGAQDLVDGRETLVLGLLWQIIRVGLMSQISLTAHPELFRLLEPGEDINDLLKLPPEQILLRWMNYHLKKSGSPKRVNNFSGDIKDSEAYTLVLNQLSSQCDKAPLNESDPSKRAEMTLVNADKLGCRKFVKARDIVAGNPKLNLAFVANLFNTCPGLEPLSEEEKAKLDEWLFASEGTREARAFCLWINSLGIEPFVNNLQTDLQNGLVILRVMDKIDPGSVDWKKVNQNLPLNKFKAIENDNYAVSLGTGHFKFSLVGVGGQDIYDGNLKLILAIVWQMMRFQVLTILKKLSKDGKPISEDQMISWANSQIAQSGKSGKITSFQDPVLKSGVYFLELLDSIRKCIDWTIVTPGATEADAMMNSKYAISIARKLGASIFLLPEDIYDVKPKMILTFVGAIMAVGLGGSN